jgi:hypothetical protein
LVRFVGGRSCVGRARVEASVGVVAGARLREYLCALACICFCD